MSKNITLLGASYSDVPAVRLPVTGGGTADFTDVSDTTATAADVAQGKYFYLSNGSRAEGTSSGGGGGIVNITQDADGYLVLDKNAGSSPAGTISITSNGTHNVAAYALANVNVSGGASACPITIYANTTAGVAQYFFVSVQMSSANDYCQIIHLRNYIASSPLSCYAVPRLDMTDEYPYQVAVYSNYANYRVYLDSSSTNCTTLYQSPSSMYYLSIGCKKNAVVKLSYENMS